jgi:hypothetical protein
MLGGFCGDPPARDFHVLTVDEAAIQGGRASDQLTRHTRECGFFA